jgi:haloalkane dehalogenase
VEVLRTPDERFAGLPDYPFAPSYAEVGGAGQQLRMHYVDVGPADAAPVLLLHGQPTWSFLYRHVIAELVSSGHRVLAPDLMGFGRSDKPTDRLVYSQAAHLRWLGDLVVGLDLRDVTLVCQDWGGPLGLGVLAREPDRFARVIATNTILHTADPALAGQTTWALYGIEDQARVVVEEALLDYIVGSQRRRLLPSSIIEATVLRTSPELLAGYDAPFPDEAYTAGMRQMPLLIPLTRHDDGARINRKTMTALCTWTKPFLTAYSEGDPATEGWDHIFQTIVPGARDAAHVTISGAGHFVQEDKPHELASVISDFIRLAP